MLELSAMTHEEVQKMALIIGELKQDKALDDAALKRISGGASMLMSSSLSAGATQALQADFEQSQIVRGLIRTGDLRKG